MSAVLIVGLTHYSALIQADWILRTRSCCQVDAVSFILSTSSLIRAADLVVCLASSGL